MRFKNKVRWALLLSLVLLVTMVVGCGNKQDSEEVIKLGFLGAKTGDVANYGIPGEKGMKMAIDELNAQGGILGKKVGGIYMRTIKATAKRLI